MTEQKVPISEKMETCLGFLDDQLEQNKKHTIKIAETIIDDIKFLTNDYYEAKKNNELASHIEKVRATQFKWINALQSAIFHQSDQTLSHEVMKSLQKFAEQLNRLQNPTLDLEIPIGLSEKIPSKLDQKVATAHPHRPVTAPITQH